MSAAACKPCSPGCVGAWDVTPRNPSGRFGLCHRLAYSGWTRMLLSPRMTLARVMGLLAFLALSVLSGASASSSAPGNVNWLSFGNTLDENRFSSLTQITPDNVSQMGRLFTFDLNKAVPGIKKGQQS